MPILDLASIAQLARDTPAFPESTLRDLVYHAQPRLTARGETIPPNGFASCVVRVGRRVLIDRSAFGLWIEKRRGAPLAHLTADIEPCPRRESAQISNDPNGPRTACRHCLSPMEGSR